MRSHLGSLEADFLFFLIRRVSIQASSPIARATAFLPPRLSKGERQHCVRLDWLDCLDWMRTNGRVREWFFFVVFFYFIKKAVVLCCAGLKSIQR